MKPSPFSYHRPDSIATALTLLAELEDAKILAGGQSLMPMMNYRYVAPEHIVDINRIPELSGITIQGDDIRIGAMTRQRELKTHTELQRVCPLIAAALHWVGHIPTRNRGTIGGSLSHLDPAAELPAVLYALDARLEIRNAESQRVIAMSEWLLGYMTPDLEADELLCAVQLTAPAADHGYGFHEFARRHGDFAMAGAAVIIETDPEQTITRAAIALAGVDVNPVRITAAEQLLCGEKANDALIAEAAEHAGEVPGLDDVHASAAYRQRLAIVMTRRALHDAVMRANTEATT